VNSRLSLAKATRSLFNVFGIKWNDSTGTRNGHFAPFAWGRLTVKQADGCLL
jgi:hypothetical protein